VEELKRFGEDCRFGKVCRSSMGWPFLKADGSPKDTAVYQGTVGSAGLSKDRRFSETRWFDEDWRSDES
jgi:hypothetical protein